MCYPVAVGIFRELTFLVKKRQIGSLESVFFFRFLFGCGEKTLNFSETIDGRRRLLGWGSTVSAAVTASGSVVLRGVFTAEVASKKSPAAVCHAPSDAGRSLGVG